MAGQRQSRNNPRRGTHSSGSALGYVGAGGTPQLTKDELFVPYVYGRSSHVARERIRLAYEALRAEQRAS